MFVKTQIQQLFRFFLSISLSILLTHSTGCIRSSEKPKVTPVKLVISTYYGDQSALLFVADKLGYFRDEGLQVELRKTVSGVTALDEIVKGVADLGTAAEFVFVHKNLSSPELRVISLLSRSQGLKLILRRDRSISSMGDLRGKTIAITKGTIAEFYFARFIEDAGLKAGEVKIVDIPPNNQPALLSEGKVDGVAVWNPVADQIATQMADKVEVRSLQGEEPYHFILVGTEQLVKHREEHLVRLLRALVRAEVYIHANRTEGGQFVASAIGLPIDTVLRLSKDTVAEVSLPRSLMLTMETQTRWLLGKTGSQQSSIPNYLEKIALEPLKKVNSDVVTIIN